MTGNPYLDNPPDIQTVLLVGNTATKPFIDDTIQVNHRLIKGIQSVNVNITIQDDSEDEYVVDTSLGNITIKLPKVSNNAGRSITMIRKTGGAFNLTVSCDVVDNINGLANQSIALQYGSMTFTTLEGTSNTWVITARSLV